MTIRTSYVDVSRQVWGWKNEPGAETYNARVTPSVSDVAIAIGCLQRIADSLEHIEKHLDPEEQERRRKRQMDKAVCSEAWDLVRAYADKYGLLGHANDGHVCAAIEQATDSPRYRNGELTQAHLDTFRARLEALKPEDIVPFITAKRGRKPRARIAQDFARLGIDIDAARPAGDTALPPPASALDEPIGVLNVGVRARKALALLECRTVGDLTRLTRRELFGLKNFGEKSLEEIRTALAALGLTLAGDTPPPKTARTTPDQPATPPASPPPEPPA